MSIKKNGINKSAKNQEPLKLKSMSQVFLKDKSVLDCVIDFLKSKQTDCVLEIGPGSGILTDLLIDNFPDISSVEKDPRFFIFCENKYKDKANFKIIHKDFLDFDIPSWASSSSCVGKNLSIVGNIPYSISSLILEKLLRHFLVLDSFVIMAQKEFIEKILSSTSPLGVLVKLLCEDCQILNQVPRYLFDPEPKVDSTILAARFKKNLVDSKFEKHFDSFFKFLKTVFLQKKKKLKNILKPIISSLQSQTNQSLNISEDLVCKRPFELQPLDLWNLFKSLNKID